MGAPRYNHSILLAFCIFALNATAQREGSAIILAPHGEAIKCRVLTKSTDALLVDTISMRNSFRECILTWQRQGFLESRIDSINFNAKPPMAFGYKGEKYQWGNITIDTVSKNWLTASGVNIARISGKTLKPVQFVQANQKILHYLEDHGYPFGKVSYNNSIVNHGILSMELSIHKGPLIVFDTLYIKGDANISYRFLKSYLGFYKGKPYSETYFKKYDSKFRSLPFISVIRPSEIEFIHGKARIYSYITDRRANRFSGLVGFQSDGEGPLRTKLTGDVHLNLINTFRRGEKNTIKWQAPGEGTQRLDISTHWPYIAGTNLGVGGNFIIYRRDSTYININPELMCDFYFANGHSLGIGLNYRKSSTIAAADNSLYGNFNTTLYRMSYSSGLLADDTFLSNYFWAKASISMGTRSVNPKMSTGSKEKNSVGEAEGSLAFFYPIYSDFVVFHSRLNAQWLFPLGNGKSQLRFMDNELYRIGGYQILRGFNQESILTHGYAVTDIELQFRVQEAINIYLLYNLGVVSSYTDNGELVSYPYGVGFGLQLITAGGILNLSYAIAEGFGHRLNLRDAKIHVGYQAKF